MVDKKITRREFVKMAGLTVFTVLVLPGLRKINMLKRPYKEAKYYKKLAG
jgi:hypothetical protein